MSLNDIHSDDELEAMSVKQLKEILMLNRVDFRGCCEKNELKERVKRLWESHKSAPRKTINHRMNQFLIFLNYFSVRSNQHG